MVRRSIIQRAFVIGSAAMAAFIFLGAVVGAVSDTVAIIPARFALIAIATLVGSATVVHITLINHPIVWLLKDGTKIRVSRLGPIALSSLAGLLVLLCIPIVGQLLRADTARRTIAPVQVRIENTTEKVITISRRAECVLWLPEGFDSGAPRLTARCNLTPKNSDATNDFVFNVAAHQSRLVIAQLTNASRFQPLFDGGEAEITVIVRDSHGQSHVSEQVLPFNAYTLRHYPETITI